MGISQLMQRVASGHNRLDDILDGGLPAHGITLVIGLPGAGKTILAQQYAFRSATPERPSVYLSTVCEPLDKILRFGQGLTFFDPSAVGRSIFYEDLGPPLARDGLPGVLGRMRALIAERRPGVVVIDSFKALRDYSDGDAPFRRFLHELAALLTAYPVTTFWVGEYAEDEVALAPEFAVADTVLSLSSSGPARRELRELSVIKLRGSGFRSGRHAYILGPWGIEVFPRPADPEGPAVDDLGRTSSGVEALDAMLEDGYRRGASTLIAGPPGVGKTVMMLHFVMAGVRDGEPGMIASLQEHPKQLERVAQAFGWALAEQDVEVMYRTPVDISIDQWVHELFESAERTGARRVAIDSLGDLQMAASDTPRFRESIHGLVRRCSWQGISLMMTYEVPALFGLTRLSENAISHLADNVVLLQYRASNGLITRTLTVLKTRAGRHDAAVRVFAITRDGIVLDGPEG